MSFPRENESTYLNGTGETTVSNNAHNLFLLARLVVSGKGFKKNDCYAVEYKICILSAPTTKMCFKFLLAAQSHLVLCLCKEYQQLVWDNL